MNAYLQAADPMELSCTGWPSKKFIMLIFVIANKTLLLKHFLFFSGFLKDVHAQIMYLIFR